MARTATLCEAFGRVKSSATPGSHPERRGMACAAMSTNDLPRDKRTEQEHSPPQYGQAEYDAADASYADYPAFVETVAEHCAAFPEASYERSRDLDIALTNTQIGIALGLLETVDDAPISVAKWGITNRGTTWYIDPDGGAER
jgi:hypothetical protein